MNTKTSKKFSSNLDIEALEQKARDWRATCVQMAYDGPEGHLASALSCVDLMIGLFYGWLKVYPEDPKNPQRDRLIFSKGHACSALYTGMADVGFFPKELLSTYAKGDSPLPNHPCIHSLPMLEMSSGSLGHGLGVATGMLYGMKMDRIDARVAVVMSDGECNEGSIWEAATFGAAHNLEGLLAVIDYNGIQAVGRSDELMGHTSLEEKFAAFGWGARTINGNNLTEIFNALNEFPFVKGRPSVIVANTTGGAGVSFMEDQILWHYRVPSDEDLSRALEELNGQPIHFAV